MKNLLIKYLLCALLSGAAVITYSQKLSYVYVAPTATLTGAFGAANVNGFTRTVSGVQVPAMTGYRYAVITPANIAAFYTIAAPNIRRTYDSITTPTSSLRTKL